MGKPLYRLAIALENKVFAGSRSMHKISHFEAEEDEIILIHVFSSLFLTFMFPFDEMNQFSRFDTDVSSERRKKIMNFYKKCVQRHLYVFGPEKYFLSKNPASSSKINSIIKPPFLMVSPESLMPGHIHMCLSVPSKFNIAFVIGFLKGTRAVRIHRDFLKQNKSKGLHFESRGYCVSIVGLDEKTIRKYICDQESNERQMAFDFE